MSVERRRDRQPQAAGAGRGAEGLVLVRLGQQRLHHHHRHGLLRALLHQPRRERGRWRGRDASRSGRSRSPPDSLFFWLVTLSTILSAVILPPLGAVRRPRGQQEAPARDAGVDRVRSSRPLIFFATGDNWLLGRRRHRPRQPVLRRSRSGQRLDPAAHLRRGRPRPGLVAGLGLRLPRRRPAARRSTSASTSGTTRSASSEGLAARLCMLSAAAWWAGFTFIPYLRLNDHPPVDVEQRRGQRVSGGASASWPRRCATCAATPWR